MSEKNSDGVGGEKKYTGYHDDFIFSHNNFIRQEFWNKSYRSICYYCPPTHNIDWLIDFISFHSIEQYFYQKKKFFDTHRSISINQMITNFGTNFLFLHSSILSFQHIKNQIESIIHSFFHFTTFKNFFLSIYIIFSSSSSSSNKLKTRDYIEMLMTTC